MHMLATMDNSKTGMNACMCESVKYCNCSLIAFVAIKSQYDEFKFVSKTMYLDSLFNY